MRVTKQSLGNQTRKSILYLDQNFFSSVHREYEWTAPLMAKLTELLDLQLLAIPYSSIHLDESDLNGHYRDELVQFVQRLSRGHYFEPHWRVQETQMLRAFQAFLDDGSAAYLKDERDALYPSVHDWDGDYSVSVFSPATDSEGKLLYKQQALDELMKVLPQWANRERTFQEDMSLEVGDAARLLLKSYATKAARVMAGDFSALINAPISASVVEGLVYLAQARNVAPTMIGEFFGSQHFAEVPTVQLSARLFSAYKAKLRSEKTPPDPKSKRTREKLSGFFYDIRHAATYAPYCQGYFTDKAMARLMMEDRVGIEQDFGCKVFCVERKEDFLAWLHDLKSAMTPVHADDLSWAYPTRFPFKKQ